LIATLGLFYVIGCSNTITLSLYHLSR